MLKPISCRKAGFDLSNKTVWIVLLSDGRDLSWTEGDTYVMEAKSELKDGKMRHYRDKNGCSKLLTLVKYAIKKFNQPKC